MSVNYYLNKTGLTRVLNHLNILYAKNKVVTGATSTANGESGLVPSPQIGDQNKCLLGSGTYGYPDLNMITTSNDTIFEPLEEG